MYLGRFQTVEMILSVGPKVNEIPFPRTVVKEIEIAPGFIQPLLPQAEEYSIGESLPYRKNTRMDKWVLRILSLA